MCNACLPAPPQWAAEALQAAGIPCLEIHSRRSQAQRDKASAAFRAADAAVMLSSDVSARGVDYPDVSLVLQCGMASSREQCAHASHALCPTPLPLAVLPHALPRSSHLQSVRIPCRRNK